MKKLPLLYILFVVALAFPIIFWATATQNTDFRSKATDSSSTPTITPLATPTNSPPRCTGISVNPGAGTKPLRVNFTCSGYDTDNDITAAEFGFGNGEKQLVEKDAGQFGSITTTYTYTQTGDFHVTCRIRDNNQVFSDYPRYCTYTVTVTDNALTPTPIRLPTPTKTVIEEASDNDPLIYWGNKPSLKPTELLSPPVIPDTPIPTTTVQMSWLSNEKVAQLVTMVFVSSITIIVALLLYGFFDK